jgi:signal transduction histidine kinase
VTGPLVVLIGLDLIVIAILLIVLDRVDRGRRSKQQALGLRLDDERAERRREHGTVIQSCHDLLNVMAVVRGHAEMVQLRTDDSQIRTDAELMIAQLDRMALITADLRRAGAPEEEAGPGPGSGPDEPDDDNRMTTG